MRIYTVNVTMLIRSGYVSIYGRLQKFFLQRSPVEVGAKRKMVQGAESLSFFPVFL